MTTRGSLQRGAVQQQFQGPAHKWKRDWVSMSSGSSNPLQKRLKLLKWVQLEERIPDAGICRFPHLIPVEKAKSPNHLSSLKKEMGDTPGSISRKNSGFEFAKGGVEHVKEEGVEFQGLIKPSSPSQASDAVDSTTPGDQNIESISGDGNGTDGPPQVSDGDLEDGVMSDGAASADNESSDDGDEECRTTPYEELPDGRETSLSDNERPQGDYSMGEDMNGAQLPMFEEFGNVNKFRRRESETEEEDEEDEEEENIMLAVSENNREGNSRIADAGKGIQSSESDEQSG